MPYTLDWQTANLDGDNNLSDGNGGNINAVVSTPGGNGSFFYESGGSAPGTLKSDNPNGNSPSEMSVTFEEPGGNPTEASNVSFNIHDIDRQGGNQNYWNDVVTINAYDLNGDPIDSSQIVFTNTSNYNVVGSNSVGTTGGSTTGDFVTVTITGNVASFEVIYTDGSGGSDGWTSISDVTFDDPIIVCFVRGSLIETENGPVSVEDLCVNDKIKTLDNGFQSIRWIGSTTRSGRGNLAPICFKKGAIGNTSDLLVSPAHRVLLNGWQAELLFGESELLASAKSMVNEKTIVVQPQETVDYFHVLFDQHEIIFSNGAATESFHPGESGVSSVSMDARDEILALFPQLAIKDHSYGPAARQTILPHEMSVLNG